MAELNIKRHSNTHEDEKTDREGCYKRGDIINVKPDGWYADYPHMTILAVPGIKVEDIYKLRKIRFEFQTKEVGIKEDEYQEVKDVQKNVIVNDKDESVVMNEIKNPVFKKMDRDIRVFDAEVLTEYQRRRFSLSDKDMDVLFPEGTYRVEITAEQFKEYYGNIFDKAHNKSIKDTPWRIAELAKEVSDPLVEVDR